MRNFLKSTFITFIVFSSGTVLAEIQGTKSDKIEVTVHGMVCAFCATGVKKGFSKIDSIKDVDVDLDKMKVSLVLNEDTGITEEEIKSTVEKSGYEYKGAKYE